MDHILDRSDDEDNIFFENPQTDSLQEAATKKRVRERLQCHGGEERNFLSPSGKVISEGFLVVHQCKTSRPCNQEGGFVSPEGCCEHCRGVLAVFRKLCSTRYSCPWDL